MPENEKERIAKLDSLSIMHTHDHETHYDTITRIIAALLQVPIALISLVHSDHQWFKSRCGLAARQTPRNTSFCAFTFKKTNPKEATMLVVEDAQADPRVAANPLVTGPPYIAFYAGSPIVISDGTRLGALCAIDQVARKISKTQAQVLVSFSTVVAQEIELVQLLEEKAEDGELDNVGGDGDLTFAAGPLRMWRMKDAITEVICLLVLKHDGSKCPLVYANRLFTHATGATIWPPKAFPGDVEVTGYGVPWDVTEEPDRKPTLWDWFQPDGKTEHECVAEMRQACEQVEKQSVSLRGSLSLLPNPSAKTVRHQVSCRITPIERPLDINSSVVRVPQMSPAEDDLKKIVNGHICFVQMISQSDDWKQMARSSNELHQQTQLGNPQVAAKSKGKKGKKPQSKGNSTGSTGSPDSDESDSARRTGTGLKAVECIRPPRSPFEDVRLVRLVGEGSFGKAYYGLWMGSPVAVKVICVRDPSKQRTMEPIFEGALSSLVAHPNLVQTFQYSSRQKPAEEGGQEIYETWIVQEWCDRGTLSKHCCTSRNEPKSLCEVLDICKDIAGAGAYLHQRGIIHGDLTANNVLIKSDISRKGYTCKICDFGLARILEGEQCEIMTTQLGTVTHMPPELFQLERANIKLTTKCDICAVGVLLWQALLGKSPFAGLSPPQVVVQVATGHRLELPADTANTIKNIFERCTATDPEKRPDFNELIDMLVSAMEEFKWEDQDSAQQ
jgi:hypothetical protein